MMYRAVVRAEGEFCGSLIQKVEGVFFGRSAATARRAAEKRAGALRAEGREPTVTVNRMDRTHNHRDGER